jgi:hypothetical protein
VYQRSIKNSGTQNEGGGLNASMKIKILLGRFTLGDGGLAAAVQTADWSKPASSHHIQSR